MDRIDQLAARLEALEAENDALRTQVEAMGPGGTAALPEPTTRIDRRSALRNLAGAAAGTVGLFAASAAIAPDRALAADGESVVLGFDNFSSSATAIRGSGIASESDEFVLSVFATEGASSGLFAEGDLDFPAVVLGDSGPPNHNGVRGGMLSSVATESVDSHLYYYHRGSSQSTTRAGRVHTSYFSNFLQLDTPTIVMRSNRTDPSLNPVGGTRTPGDKLEGGVVYTLDLSSHVDIDATGVVLNVTDFDQSEDGTFATIWDGDGSPPPVKTISSQAGVIATNLAMTALSPMQTIGIFVKDGTSMHLRLELIGQIRSGEGEGGEF